MEDESTDIPEFLPGTTDLSQSSATHVFVLVDGYQSSESFEIGHGKTKTFRALRSVLQLRMGKNVDGYVFRGPGDLEYTGPITAEIANWHCFEERPIRFVKKDDTWLAREKEKLKEKHAKEAAADEHIIVDGNEMEIDETRAVRAGKGKLSMFVFFMRHPEPVLYHFYVNSQTTLSNVREQIKAATGTPDDRMYLYKFYSAAEDGVEYGGTHKTSQAFCDRYSKPQSPIFLRVRKDVIRDKRKAADAEQNRMDAAEQKAREELAKRRALGGKEYLIPIRCIIDDVELEVRWMIGQDKSGSYPSFQKARQLISPEVHRSLTDLKQYDFYLGDVLVGKVNGYRDAKAVPIDAAIIREVTEGKQRLTFEMNRVIADERARKRAQEAVHEQLQASHLRREPNIAPGAQTKYLTVFYFNSNVGTPVEHRFQITGKRKSRGQERPDTLEDVAREIGRVYLIEKARLKSFKFFLGDRIAELSMTASVVLDFIRQNGVALSFREDPAQIELMRQQRAAEEKEHERTVQSLIDMMGGSQVAARDATGIEWPPTIKVFLRVGDVIEERDVSTNRWKDKASFSALRKIIGVPKDDSRNYAFYLHGTDIALDEAQADFTKEMCLALKGRAMDVRLKTSVAAKRRADALESLAAYKAQKIRMEENVSTFIYVFFVHVSTSNKRQGKEFKVPVRVGETKFSDVFNLSVVKMGELYPELLVPTKGHRLYQNETTRTPVDLKSVVFQHHVDSNGSSEDRNPDKPPFFIEYDRALADKRFLEKVASEKKAMEYRQSRELADTAAKGTKVKLYVSYFFRKGLPDRYPIEVFVTLGRDTFSSLLGMIHNGIEGLPEERKHGIGPPGPQWKLYDGPQTTKELKASTVIKLAHASANSQMPRNGKGPLYLEYDRDALVKETAAMLEQEEKSRRDLAASAISLEASRSMAQNLNRPRKVTVELTLDSVKSVKSIDVSPSESVQAFLHKVIPQEYLVYADQFLINQKSMKLTDDIGVPLLDSAEKTGTQITVTEKPRFRKRIREGEVVIRVPPPPLPAAPPGGGGGAPRALPAPLVPNHPKPPEEAPGQKRQRARSPSGSEGSDEKGQREEPKDVAGKEAPKEKSDSSVNAVPPAAGPVSSESKDLPAPEQAAAPASDQAARTEPTPKKRTASQEKVPLSPNPPATSALPPQQPADKEDPAIAPSAAPKARRVDTERRKRPLVRVIEGDNSLFPDLPPATQEDEKGEEPVQVPRPDKVRDQGKLVVESEDQGGGGSIVAEAAELPNLVAPAKRAMLEKARDGPQEERGPPGESPGAPRGDKIPAIPRDAAPTGPSLPIDQGLPHPMDTTGESADEMSKRERENVAEESGRQKRRLSDKAPMDDSSPGGDQSGDKPRVSTQEESTHPMVTVHEAAPERVLGVEEIDPAKQPEAARAPSDGSNGAPPASPPGATPLITVETGAAQPEVVGATTGGVGVEVGAAVDTGPEPNAAAAKRQADPQGTNPDGAKPVSAAQTDAKEEKTGTDQIEEKPWVTLNKLVEAFEKEKGGEGEEEEVRPEAQIQVDVDPALMRALENAKSAKVSQEDEF